MESLHVLRISSIPKPPQLTKSQRRSQFIIIAYEVMNVNLFMENARYQ